MFPTSRAIYPVQRLGAGPESLLSSLPAVCYATRNCRGVCRLSSCTEIWGEYPISIRLLFFLALIIEISFQNPVDDTPEWSSVTSSHGTSDASTKFWAYNLGKPSKIRSYSVNYELSATMFTRGKGDRVLVMCALTAASILLIITKRHRD